jgi:serine/threonine-protein kinase
MATVYRVHDPALDRDVALKVLPAEFLHDPAFAARFQQEARVAAKLEHPHIVPVHAFGIEAGRPWMAMRLLAGGSLAERVRRGPLAPREAAALLRGVAGALDYAHARGIVHRDVKPANVLLDEGGRAYLADFGIARMLEGSPIVTATGLIQGSPTYMAPEQAMGEKVDRLADVYALGVMAFECLTGRVPYTGTTPVAILMKHVREPVPEPTEAGVAPPLAAVVRRCLAKAPAERWPSAGAFAVALEQSAAGLTSPAGAESLPTLTVPPTPAPGTYVGTAASRRRRNWLWAAAGGALALALLIGGGLLVLSLLRPPPGPGASPRPAAPAPSPSPSPTARKPERSAMVAPGRAATSTPRPARPAATPLVAPAESTPAPPEPTSLPPAPTLEPQAPSAPSGAEEDRAHAFARARTGKIRVYCEARLEPVLFRKAGRKDVTDSLKDLEEAIAKHGILEVVPRDEADAVVQVLERGRDPALIGMRKVRVRVVLGRESVELTGQDSVTSFNTWSGAANGAAKQLESWLKGRLGSPD